MDLSLFTTLHVAVVSCLWTDASGSRVYPFLCRAVRNCARDHGNVPLNKEFYVALEDLPTRHK